MDSLGVSSRILDTLQNKFIQYPDIQKVLLFGSRSKGNYRPGSDIDLCIIAPNWRFNDLLKLEFIIEDLALPYKFDLI